MCIRDRSAQYGSIQAYEMARLDAENNVQDAIKKTTDLSIASQNQAIKVHLDELAAASALVGSLRGLFGALGDDLEAFAIAEQALAVAQIIIDAQKQQWKRWLHHSNSDLLRDLYGLQHRKEL